LATYIRGNIPYNLMGTTTSGPLELQALIIPVSARLNLCLANAYLSPEPSANLTSTTPPNAWLQQLEAVRADVIYGYLNVHHVVWDVYAQAITRGAMLLDWMEDNAKSSLSDGAPTRSARFNQGSGFSTPDITIVRSGIVDRFRWETLQELGSDYLPILVRWNQGMKVKRPGDKLALTSGKQIGPSSTT